MPSSVNGIGTGLVAASKKRTVEGHVQFDAVEALMAEDLFRQLLRA